MGLPLDLYDARRLRLEEVVRELDVPLEGQPLQVLRSPDDALRSMHDVEVPQEVTGALPPPRHVGDLGLRLLSIREG